MTAASMVAAPRIVGRATLQVSFVLALLLFWQLASGRLLNSYYVSRPSEVLAQILHWIDTGYLWPHLLATLTATGLGFAAAAMFGLAAALLLGSVAVLDRLLGPLIYLAYSLPKIVLAPMLILWLGVGWLPPLAMAFVTGFFMMFFNCYTGIRVVSPALLNSVALMGASPLSSAIKIRIPAALPYIAVGLHQGLVYAFHGAIIGEMTASNLGMGYVLLFAAHSMDATGVIAALVVIAGIALVLIRLMDRGISLVGAEALPA